MCTNFRPSTPEHIRLRFGVEALAVQFRDEAYPGYLAPIVRRPFGDVAGLECIAAGFGLIPPWAKDDKIARQTYNARSETVAEKPSYRSAWKRRQLCLVPMRSFYEPNYESGKAVRWRIEREDHADFAAAGIWERWVRDGEPVFSFSLLTINADGHALMGQFHKPGDEKRSLVVVPPEDTEAWLSSDTELGRAFFGLATLMGFTAQPAPAPIRAKAEGLF